MKKMTIARKRPIPVRVMLSSMEKKTLIEAADQIGVALSVFLRIAALEAAKRREREEKAA